MRQTGPAQRSCSPRSLRPCSAHCVFDIDPRGARARRRPCAQAPHETPQMSADPPSTILCQTQFCNVQTHLCQRRQLVGQLPSHVPDGSRRTRSRQIGIHRFRRRTGELLQQRGRYDSFHSRYRHTPVPAPGPVPVPVPVPVHCSHSQILSMRVVHPVCGVVRSRCYFF